MNKVPHFRGIVAPSSQLRRCHPLDRAEDEHLIWTVERPQLRLHAGGEHLNTVCFWHRPDDRRNRVSVLAFGSFYLSSDAQYGEKAPVEQLPIEAVPDAVAALYNEHGTAAFALFDGDFSLVLCDPNSASLFLVVDKLGCNDIYVRQEAESLFFASQPDCLLDGSTPLDPLAVTFLLAQEGFIPAPFTLASCVQSIGRARYLRITRGRQGLEAQSVRYWSSSASQAIRSSREARGKFSCLLESAVEVRLGDDSAVLLSGGVDSSLVFNFAARRRKRALLALTGAIRGYSDSERDIAAAKYLAKAFRVPHEAVVLDPADDTLPEELVQCTASWMNGTRLALPLWRRYAQRLRSCLGAGYSVLAGQTADTLADNNFTLPSPGYTLRRLFFSSWFLRSMPLLRRLAPAKESSVGRLLAHIIRFTAGMRVARMFESLLDGLTDRERFYAGRLFGYGEFPGLAEDYFPMLTAHGFKQVTDWYCTAFVRPVVQRIEPSNFYREMIDLSMDMVMLHLDSRLLFHVYRLEGGKAQLPFMDARVVNFFANLPYISRAIWREPKHLIRAQMRGKGMIRPKAITLQGPSSTKSPEELLLDGSIGALFRELLAGPTFVDRVPGLLELLRKGYLEDQIDLFRKGQPGVNFKFIAKVGTFEIWSRALAEKKAIALQRATA